MNKKQKFKNFLESLKGSGQDTLIESVKSGFQACFENYGHEEEWDDGYGSNEQARSVENYRQQLTPEDDSAKIDALVKQGRYVLISESPVFHPSIDLAVIGWEHNYISDHNTYEEANSVMSKENPEHYEHPEGGGGLKILPEPKREPPQEPPQESNGDELPF